MSLLRTSRLPSVLFVCGALALGACTTTVPEGKPLPDMTFAHIQPLSVNVAAVEIENRFNPASDPQDVTSSFPAAPDIMLRRYAELGLEP